MFLLKSAGLVTSKEVSYFGTIVTVPDYTVAIATDSDGAIYAYESVPECDGGAGRGYGGWLGHALYARTLLGTATFGGNWEDSLMILEN